MRLSSADLEGALELVREVGEADGAHAFRTVLVERLPRLVPSTITSFNEIAGGRLVGSASPATSG